MIHKRPRTRGGLIASLTLLAVAAAALAASDAQLAGNDRALWLVDGRRWSDPQEALRVRPAGQAWKQLRQPFASAPTASVALGRRLHVLLTDGGHVAYELSGAVSSRRRPQLAGWAAGKAPLAACDATALGDDRLPAIVAIVDRPLEAKPGSLSEPSTQPATQPASQPATQPSTRGARSGALARLGVFRYRDGSWTHLSDLPGSWLRDGRLTHCACAEGRLIVVVADARARQRVLLRFDGENWSRQALDLPAGSEVAGLHALDGVVAAVLAMRTEPADANASADSPSPPVWALELALVDSEGLSTPQPLRRAGEAFTVAGQGPPKTARLSDQLALAWREGDGWRNVLFGPDAQVTDGGRIEAEPAVTGGGGRLLMYFVIALLAASFLPSLFMRPRSATLQPFSLPEGVRPASVFKRAAAFAIDMALPLLLGVVLFLPEEGLEAASRQYQRLLEDPSAAEGKLPVWMAAMNIASMTIFLLYATATELRFGATLGKLALGMRVVGEGARRPGPREILLRNLWKLLELLVIVPPFVPILPLAMLLNRNRQRIGDWLARTTIVDGESLERFRRAAGTAAAEAAGAETGEPFEAEPPQDRADSEDENRAD